LAEKINIRIFAKFAFMKDLIYEFISAKRLAVVSTVNGSGKPESALVGIAITPELEIVFDTVTSSRKYRNLLQNADIAVVVGWDNEITVQYEGEAEVLDYSTESYAYREIYYAAWPDGRERAEKWEGLVHFKIRPKWLRYSNYNAPVTIEELKF